MLKLKKIVLLLFIATSIVSCSKKENKGFTIEGQITGAENERIVLKTFSFPNINGAPKTVVIDTARSDAEGKFIIENFLPERSICVLSVLGNSDYNLWLSLHNETMQLKATTQDAMQTSTEGSTASTVLHTFIATMNSFNLSIMQNRQMYADYMKQGNDSIAKTYMQNMNYDIDQYFAFVNTFADTTKDVATAVLAMESFIYDEQFEKIKAVADKRKITTDSSSVYMKELLTKIAKYESFLAVSEAKSLLGKPAPEITLQSPDGKQYKLSDLKGSYVLIDFWASWCGPCRAENPNVVETYNLYKNKNFTIYSVSLDDNKDAWVKAIEKDKLTWPYHVSELTKWNSATAKTYNVSGIPMNFLVDKEGTIIAQNLRGENLKIKLAEVIQ